MRPACVVVAIVAACGGAPPVPAPAHAEPEGLWGAEHDFHPAAPVRVRIAHQRDAWLAQLGDARVSLVASGDEQVATFPTGTLHVRVLPDGPRAHWVQPDGTIVGTFATLVPLVADGHDAWVGTVAPLADRVRFYLVIRADGTAFVREAEANAGMMLGELRVAHAAGGFEFRNKRGELVMTGKLDGERLRVAIPRLKVELELTRRSRDDAPGFYPRASRDGHYGYARPIDRGDGWSVAAADDVGIPRDRVEAVVQHLVDTVPTSLTTPAIHALVVARHGKLVVEEYFAGDGPDELHDLRSASKSITTTLVGLGVDARELAVTDRVVDLLGPRDDDPRRADMRVEHLLTMSSGLACDDNDDASPGNEETMQDQTAQKDWYRYTWELPMANPPGSRALYCSGTMNLLGAVLGKVGHPSLVAYAADRLFAPLDITHAAINLMPDGRAYAGGGTRLRARDFAKLAQLVLDRGTWRGRRVVSADWLATATAGHASMNGTDNYGFGWWRMKYRVGGRDVDAVYASGNGGQLAIAVPELDIAVAIDAGNYNNFPAWGRFYDEVVKPILEAAR